MLNITSQLTALIGDIRRAQTEIMRISPYRDVGLVPNPPARREAIEAAEQRLGMRLPPSYRAFLELHDGWPRFYDGANLLGAASLGQRSYRELATAALECAETPLPDSAPASRTGRDAERVVPFGIDGQATTLFAFDARRPAVGGELEVIAWVGEIGLRRAGFVGFLSMVRELCESELRAQRAQSTPPLRAVG